MHDKKVNKDKLKVRDKKVNKDKKAVDDKKVNKDKLSVQYKNLLKLFGRTVLPYLRFIRIKIKRNYSKIQIRKTVFLSEKKSYPG